MLGILCTSCEDFQIISTFHHQTVGNRVGDFLCCFDTSFQNPIRHIYIFVIRCVLQGDAFAIWCTVFCKEIRTREIGFDTISSTKVRTKSIHLSSNNVLIAIGPFLIFLLKTLPSSLPNEAGAGSTAVDSIGCCPKRLVSLSSNLR
jgi:hypothetical protein